MLRSDTARISWRTPKWIPYRGTRKSKTVLESCVVLSGREILSLAHRCFFCHCVTIQRGREPRRGGAPGKRGPQRGGEGLQYQSQVHSMLHAPHAK